MRMHFLLLMMCLIPAVALGNAGDESLRMLLAKSEVVVLGEFTSEVIGACDEAGVVHYQGDFRIAELMKGKVQGDCRTGGVIKVNAIRFEMEPSDRLPQLKQHGRAILFLTCNDRQSPPSYLVSDNWLGIQPASPIMAKTLSALAKAAKNAGAENQAAKTPPQEPNTAAPPPRPAYVQLAGNWRLFLPAGFEYEATLAAEKEGCYRLTPGGLAFGARYEVQGDYLVSVGAEDGVFKWKIQSPYMLTLVEQPAKSSSDYLGAVFVRLSPAAQLHLQRQASLNR